jgi:hypothetical protein
VRLRALNEAECYARCYGAHEEAVQVIELPPKVLRFEPRISGEDLRRLFELRLDAREPEARPVAA